MKRADLRDLVLLAALWGASYMFIKIALDDGLSAPTIEQQMLAGIAELV